MSDIIEKARTAVQRQVGDAHPKNPGLVWTEYQPGKFDWRKKGTSSASTSTKVDHAASDGDDKGGTKTPSKPSSSQVANAKARQGKMDTAKLIDWAAKTSDANLLKVASNPQGNAMMRKVAYDALKDRDYDMTKVNTSGTLQSLLKMVQDGGSSSGQTKVAPTAAGTSVDIDDDADEGGNDDGEITEKWYLNPNDDRVKKLFNLKTKAGRIKYDQFLYKMKKKEKDYMKPVEVIQDLNEQYLEFLDNDEQRFMISAGGAGIGKSYGFNKIAELLNKKPYDPDTDKPGDDDYDIFEAPDVNSGKQLLNILKAHNGKIIVFDDNDKVLRRADCASVMKKATATTGKRIVGDPDDIKQNFEFTGRIMIMTNKNLAKLATDEDTKAIISRAMMVSEIYLTVPETIEVMKSRFQDYEFKQAPRLDDENEDKKERQEILDLIVKNQKNIDPAQFTTRTFQEILVSKRKVDNANAKRKNAAFASLIGSEDKDWKEKAVASLTKAYEEELGNGAFETIEKAEDEEILRAEELLFGDEVEKGGNKHDFSEGERKKLSKKGEAMKDGSFPIRNTQDLKDAIKSVGRAKNPDKAKSWIKKRAKELGKESLLPDTWKAESLFDDMTIEKAENILFGM